MIKEDFITEVEVGFYFSQKDKYADDIKIMLSYDLEFEYRSWGCKGVYPLLQDEMAITYFEREFNDDDVEIEKAVIVKLNDLKREWVKSTDGIGTPESIDLWIKEDGSVDYEMSSITFWMAES